MKKTTKTAITLLCALAMIIPTCVFGADVNTEPGGEHPDKPSGGGTTGEEETTKEEETTEEEETTTEYTYVSFGSYPQTEIVSQASDSGVYGRTWACESDYIVDATLYGKLADLADSEWDANGDATVDGNKYRRIKESDATCSKSADDESTESESTETESAETESTETESTESKPPKSKSSETESADNNSTDNESEEIESGEAETGEAETGEDETGEDETGEDETGEAKSEETEKSTPTESDTADMYFNWSSSNTYHYFKYEPIKWRVIKQNGNDYFLLSEIALDDRMYNTILNGSITWENSTIRSWLNGYDSSYNAQSTDYSSSNFIDTAFTADEQSKIATTTVSNKINISDEEGIVSGADTSDKIFLLSDDEMCTAAYGFSENSDTDNSARKSLSSTYAKAMGTKSDDNGNCYWWLRSPGSHPGLTVMIRQTGSVYVGGQHASSKSRGVRPAIHVVFSGNTSGGTIATKKGDFNNDGEVTAQDLVRLRDYLANYDYEKNTSTTSITSSADMNDDGVINLKDLVSLRVTLASQSDE